MLLLNNRLLMNKIFCDFCGIQKLISYCTLTIEGLNILLILESKLRNFLTGNDFCSWKFLIRVINIVQTIGSFYFIRLHFFRHGGYFKEIFYCWILFLRFWLWELELRGVDSLLCKHHSCRLWRNSFWLRYWFW